MRLSIILITILICLGVIPQDLYYHSNEEVINSSPLQSLVQPFSRLKDENQPNISDANWIYQMPLTVTKSLETEANLTEGINFSTENQTDFDIQITGNGVGWKTSDFNNKSNFYWKENSESASVVNRCLRPDDLDNYTAEFFINGNNTDREMEFQNFVFGGYTPNFYFSDTNINFDYIFKAANEQTLGVRFEMNLVFKFAVGNEEGTITFMLGYNPDFFHPSSNVTVSEPPSLDVTIWVNELPMLDWCSFSYNITDILRENLPISQYPSVERVFSNITDVKMRFKSFSKSSEANFSLDNILLNCQNISDFIPTLRINEDTFTPVNGSLNLNLTAVSSIFIRWDSNHTDYAGKVNISLLAMHIIPIRLEITSTATMEIIGWYSSQLPEMLTQNSTFLLSFIVPRSWEFVSDYYQSVLSEFNVTSSADSDVLEKKICVSTENNQMNLTFKIPNVISVSQIPETIHQGLPFSIEGTLTSNHTSSILVVFQNNNYSLNFTTKIFFDGSFRFERLVIPDGAPIGSYHCTVIFNTTKVFGYFFEIIQIETSFETLLLAYQPVVSYQYISALFSIELTAGGTVIGNATVFFRTYVDWKEMIPTEQCYLGFTQPLVTAGLYEIQILAFWKGNTWTWSIPITVLPSQAIISFNDLPAYITENTSLPIPITAEILLANGTYLKLSNMSIYSSLNLNGTFYSSSLFDEENYAIFFLRNENAEKNTTLFVEITLFCLNTAIAGANTTLQIIEDNNSSLWKRLDLIQSTNLEIETNQTKAIMYQVKYNTLGSHWKALIPVCHENINNIYLKRQNVIYPVIINNYEIFWKIEANITTTDEIVFELKGPALLISRFTDSNIHIIKGLIQSSGNFPEVVVTIPLTPIGKTVEVWSLLDEMGRNISDNYDLEAYDSILQIRNISLKEGTTFNFTLTGHCFPIEIISAILPQGNQSYSELINFSARIKASACVFGKLNVLLTKSGTKKNITYSQNLTRITENQFDFSYSIRFVEWSDILSYQIVFCDQFNNQISTEWKEIRIIDTIAPYCSLSTQNILLWEEIQIHCSEPSGASGVATVYLQTNDGIKTEFKIVGNTSKYTLTLTESTATSGRIITIDFAGNVWESQELNIVMPSDSSSLFGNLDFIPLLLVGGTCLAIAVWIIWGKNNDIFSDI